MSSPPLHDVEVDAPATSSAAPPVAGADRGGKIAGRPALADAFGALAAHRLAVAIIAWGAVLRVARYLWDRSLWLDESYLAINLSTRSYGELFETLDFNQGAPAGFLLAEKLAFETLGDSERALRFFPLLAGLTSLFLFYAVARRFLAGPAVLLALLLFATIEGFVYYSAEGKQYGFDVAVTLALLYVYVRVAEASEASASRAAIVGGAGAAAVWLSYPSVFVLVGFAAAWSLTPVWRRQWRTLGLQAAAYSVWLVSFAVGYIVSVRDLSPLRETVVTAPVDVGSRLNVVVKSTYLMFADPGRLPRTAVGLAALLSVVGLAVVGGARWSRATFVLGTGAAMLAAGYLGRYPVGQRFVLFLLPLAVLCLAAGAVAITQQLPRRLAVALGAGIAALVIIPPLAGSAVRLVRPPAQEEIVPILSAIERQWREGDVLYISSASQYALRYYLFCDECSDRAAEQRAFWPVSPHEGAQPQWTPALVSRSPSVVIGQPARDMRADYARELDRLRGEPRVWLLFTHYFPLTRADILDPLSVRATRIECFEEGVALGCLYDFSR
jgi:hypothetical protein